MPELIFLFSRDSSFYLLEGFFLSREFSFYEIQDDAYISALFSVKHFVVELFKFIQGFLGMAMLVCLIYLIKLLPFHILYSAVN